MKRINIYLVILIIALCISGCNKNSKIPEKGFNQSELWDYLDNYTRYLSIWGPEDSALIFENEDQLIFDNSLYHNEGFDYSFTELVSFNYEGNNLYKLEYQNPYPDSFESSIFYIELIPENPNEIRFGMYSDGKLEFFDLFADVGLTSKQLFAEFAKYDFWLEADNRMSGLYYFNVSDNNKFNLGITNSDYELSGTISKIEYLGYMFYSIIVDYPGFEKDDRYDQYSIEYIICFNPDFEKLLININNKLIEFTKEVKLTSDELFSALSKYEKWLQVDGDIHTGYFIISHDQNKFDLGLSDSDFWLSGSVSEIKYNGHMSYIAVVSYPDYEGDETTDPYNPYSREYYLYFNPTKEILIVESAGENIEFMPDIGLTAEEFITALSNYDYWYEYKNGYIRHFLKFYDENKFQSGLMDTESSMLGTISKIKYCGEFLYEITVDYPGFEGNELQAPYDPYTLTYRLYYVPENEKLVMIINYKFIDFFPANY